MMMMGDYFPSVLSRVVTTSGAGSITAPNGYTSVTVEAIGGGGNGFGGSLGVRASGGGGLFACSDANIIVIEGITVVYYSVGTAGNQSWVNVGTNVAPVLSAVGCLGKNGGNAASAVAGSGATAGSVGATVRNGGNGATGSSAGGGGAGASTAGSGSTAGTDSTGLSPATPMGSGTGGVYNSGSGTAPGGGGGAATSGSAGNRPGSVGRVRITFYV